MVVVVFWGDWWQFFWVGVFVWCEDWEDGFVVDCFGGFLCFCFVGIYVLGDLYLVVVVVGDYNGFVWEFCVQGFGNSLQVVGIECGDSCVFQCFGYCGGGGIVFVDYQCWCGCECIYVIDDMEVFFFVVVFGEVFGVVFLDVLYGLLFVVGVVGWDVGFLVFLVGKDVGVYLQIFVVQVWCWFCDGNQVLCLVVDVLCCGFVLVFLFFGMCGQFGCCFGLYFGFFGGVQGVVFGFLFYFDVGVVVFDVIGWVVVEVVDVEV